MKKDVSGIPDILASCSYTYIARTRSSKGTPEMKATNLSVLATRIPICQSGT